jgi:hypothetical protein
LFVSPVRAWRFALPLPHISSTSGIRPVVDQAFKVGLKANGADGAPGSHFRGFTRVRTITVYTSKGDGPAPTAPDFDAARISLCLRIRLLRILPSGLKLNCIAAIQEGRHMRKIQPVHMGKKGPEVTNLHLGLVFLIAHQDGISDNDRKTLLERLAPEMRDNEFGEVTRELVGMYQEQLKHWPNYWPKLPKKIADIVRDIPANYPGDVDKGTAEALNWLVETFRKMQSPPPPRGNLRPARDIPKTAD